MKLVVFTVRVMLALVLLAGTLAVTPAQPVSAQGGEAADKGFSPQEFLNPDGTLNLSEDFSGALDLDGWNVTIDPDLGPVFEMQATGLAANWQALDTAGQGALKEYVNAIAVSGTDIYIGGNFVNANNIPEADYVVKWDGANWSALGSDGAGNGSITNAVYAILVDGNDVYVGGNFHNVNNHGTELGNADFIAKWDGANWSALGSNGNGGSSINGSVFALAMDSLGVLYAGGSFINVLDETNGLIKDADYLAKWDGSAWDNVGTGSGGNGSLNNMVHAITFDGADNIYVGGNFTDVDDNGTTIPAADYIAKWDGFAWSALGGSGGGDGSLHHSCCGQVKDIIVNGTDIYVAGQFENTHNGAVTLNDADNIAKFDTTTGEWSSLGTGYNGNGSLSTAVNKLVMIGGELYAGGFFSVISNGNTFIPQGAYIAKWDGATWHALSSDGGNGASLNSSARALAASGTELLVGGTFTNVNNNGTILHEADYLAKWDGSDWSAVDTLGAVNGSLGNQVNAIFINGTDVYVGGSFVNVANINPADYVAKWDGSEWSALGVGYTSSDTACLNGPVYALAMDGNDLYVGGGFVNIVQNNTILSKADYVAKWDGTTWSALGENGSNDGSLNNYVYALDIDNNHNLYAGGQFYNVNNNGTLIPEADYVAKWDGSNWSALGGSSLNVNSGSLKAGSVVFALETSGSDVYVGGLFEDVEDGNTVLAEADGVARWDGNNWHALGSNGLGGGAITGYVLSIAASDNNVYVGGSFHNAAGISEADHVAKWDGSTWSALGSDGAGNGALNEQVNRVFAVGQYLIVGGNFTNLADGTGDYIALWDGNNWHTIGNNGAGNGSLNDEVYAVAMNGNTLFAGGAFYNVNNHGVQMDMADYIASTTLTPPTQGKALKSSGSQDGWVLESSETSGKGGKLNKGASTLNVGDDAANKQYRAVLSFDTVMPANAVITGITLKFKYAGKTGTLPFSTHGKLLVDVRKGSFANNAALQLSDFKAGASKNALFALTNSKTNGWYVKAFTPAQFQFINVNGITQFRLRFAKDDNNDSGADLLKIYSGNASSASQPQLVIEYYIPFP